MAPSFADLCTLTTTAIAVIGLNAWRREAHAKPRMEAALELLTAFYEAKEALSQMRSGFTFGGESKDRVPSPNETADQRAARDQGFVPIARFTHLKEKFHRLYALNFKFMALFGKQAGEPVWNLRRQVNRVIGAGHTIASLKSAPGWESSPTRSKSVEKQEAILWEMGEDDPILVEVEIIEQQLEDLCSEVVRPPISRFGRIWNVIWN